MSKIVQFAKPYLVIASGNSIGKPFSTGKTYIQKPGDKRNHYTKNLNEEKVQILSQCDN